MQRLFFLFFSRLVLPLLDVLNQLGEKHDNCDTSDETGELPDGISEVSEGEATTLMEQFKTGEFSDEDVSEQDVTESD